MSDSSGFLVKFNNVGRRKTCWEERISRPVTNTKIAKAVEARGVIRALGIDAESTSDYGGTIYAADRPVGDYFIVPGSEIKPVAAERVA